MRKLMVVSGLCVLALGAVALADGAATRPAAAQASSNDLLTAQEIRKLVDAGQYRDALKSLQRVLQLKGAAAGDYDMHEMTMLKAECLLQTHQNKSALETLQAAADIAFKDNNEQHAAEANALILLIQKSPADLYTPKTAIIKKPIPILDRTLRKDAYEALFNDEFMAFSARAKAALATMSLQVTADAATMAIGIRAVERVATGSNKQSEDLMTQLAQHAVKMINVALDDLVQQTRRISDNANKLITSDVTENMPGGRQEIIQHTTRRGLLGGDRDNLNTIIATCTKIPPACEKLSKALGVQQDAFHVAALKAENVKRDATTALNENYSGQVNQPNY